MRQCYDPSESHVRYYVCCSILCLLLQPNDAARMIQMSAFMCMCVWVIQFNHLLPSGVNRPNETTIDLSRQVSLSPSLSLARSSCASCAVKTSQRRSCVHTVSHQDQISTHSSKTSSLPLQLHQTEPQYKHI